jgi:hypothetical protein
MGKRRDVRGVVHARMCVGVKSFEKGEFLHAIYGV